eukprot:gene13240-17746_t
MSCPSVEKWKKLDLIMIRHAESFNNSIYDLIKEKYGENLSEEFIQMEEIKMRQEDSSLSLKGFQQATALGEYVGRNGFNVMTGKNSTDFEWKIISSPMKRCLITSSYILNYINKNNGNNIDISKNNTSIAENEQVKSVEVVPFLYELHGCYGLNEEGNVIGVKGYNNQQIQELFPNFYCMKNNDINLMENGWYDLPGKESYSHFLARTEECVSWIWSLVENQDREYDGIVLVIHGMLIGSIINSLSGAKSASNLLTVHNNTGYSHLQLFSTQNNINNTNNTNENNKRMAAIKSINRVDHLMNNPDLLTGNDVFHDHWMQEFLEDTH